MAALTIPQFLARSVALEARLRKVLPEYTLLYGQYEEVRNDAIPENNPVPGGAVEVNMVAADNLKADVDAAFAGVMNAIEQICLVNQAGGRRRRKRRARKTRRSRK
jgi:hypothetical protein